MNEKYKHLKIKYLHAASDQTLMSESLEKSG